MLFIIHINRIYNYLSEDFIEKIIQEFKSNISLLSDIFLNWKRESNILYFENLIKMIVEIYGISNY